MKILGIDYGRKRMGLALCNVLKVACPSGVIIHTDWSRDMIALSEIIEEQEIARIVVGLPKNMNDSLGEMAEEVKKFAESLQHCFSQIPVVLWDERLTTWQAERLLLDAGISPERRKNVRDAIAAAVMLQCYVDSHPDVWDSNLNEERIE